MRTEFARALGPRWRSPLSSWLLLAAWLPALPLLCSPVAEASTQPLFAPAVSFPTGARPTSVAAGDFNADGRLDVAVTNANSNTVSVFLGNGDGTFGPTTDFATGTGPWSVATGDMNADGRVDLVVANNFAASVCVLLGRGDGTFAPKVDFATGGGPWCVRTGDLNADGRLDLAVANANSNTASVLLGNGDGSFAAKVDYRTGAIPTGIAIGDLNRDGRPDLAVADYDSDALTILLGRGDGTFAGAVDYWADAKPLSLAIGDLNSDGLPDLALGNFPLSIVSVFRGTDAGTFETRIAKPETGPGPYSVAVGDLNADGYPDLATANLSLGTVSAIPGNGDGSFAARQDYAAGPGCHNIAIADLDADRRLDLIVANSDGNTISVLRNIGPFPGRPLTVVAPASVVGPENAALQFEVTAADPDGGAIVSLTAAPLPGGASFAVNATNTSGTLDWTPTYTQAGTYIVAFTASNTASGSASTTIQITNVYDPPVVTGPSSISGAEGTEVTFAVSASDPDGAPITLLTAAPLPVGSSFDVAPGNAAGTFRWTPGFAQAGEYSVTISAESARRPGGVSGTVIVLTGTLCVHLTIVNADRPPVLVTPGAQTAQEGVLLSFVVAASDPDGEAISSLTASPLPAGAAFSSNAASASGTFSWTPAYGQAGPYAITFTASNALGASAVVPIEVSRTNRPPVLSAPGGVYTSEGALVSFPVSAVDPDGDHVSLGVLGLPVGATFVDLGNNTGSFVWVPGYGQAGAYLVVFTARDDAGLEGAPKQVSISVTNQNRAPVADPHGPYSGIIGVPILFDGTASSDPDGDALAYAWQFGDGGEGSGALPRHAYVAGGAFLVNLRVDDGHLSAAASTSVTIQDVFAARAFTTGANATIRLGSGKATWYVQIEPVDGSYLNTAVVSSTISMKYGGDQILAQAGKGSIESDRDANGVHEITVCFSKTDLRTLFAGLPKGTNTVTVTLEGDLATGGKFRATLTVDVVSTGGSLAASVSPNPLNPQATLTFETSVPGHVRVSIFDMQGRRVRTILQDRDLPAGYHDFAIDGRSDLGPRLASGVYFCRIEAPDGVVTARFAILK